MWKQNKTRKQIRNAEPKKSGVRYLKNLNFLKEMVTPGYREKAAKLQGRLSRKKKFSFHLQSLKRSLSSPWRHAATDISSQPIPPWITPKQNASQFSFTSTSMRVVQPHEWHENLSWRWSSSALNWRTYRARSRERRERFRNKSWQAELFK